jgi:hypothetical protein
MSKSTDFNFGWNVTGASDRVGAETQGENMIPRSSGNSNQSRNGGTRKGSGFRFLNADMLSSAHQLATIVDARTQPDSFRPNQQCVVVKLRFKNEYILWTLRTGNPSLETIGDAIGEDETTWKNREIELFIEEDSFDGKKWIRCEVVSAVSSSLKKGK